MNIHEAQPFPSQSRDAWQGMEDIEEFSWRPRKIATYTMRREVVVNPVADAGVPSAPNVVTILGVNEFMANLPA